MGSLDTTPADCYFKFQSDSINPVYAVQYQRSTFYTLNSNLILLIPPPNLYSQNIRTTLNSNLILLIQMQRVQKSMQSIDFKFQSDSINPLHSSTRFTHVCLTLNSNLILLIRYGSYSLYTVNEL